MRNLLLAVCLTTAALLTPEAPAQSLSRGPYLQNGSTTAVTVRWRTSASATGVVRYGTNPSNLDQSATGSSTQNHEIRLTGLRPDTTYYYSVGHGTTVLASGASCFFVTAPVAAKPTRVWVLGDSGSGTSAQKSVRDAYYNHTGSRHTDLWLMLGDNAYESGTDAEYQSKLFDIYPAMLRKSVLWPAYGNHDAVKSSSSSQSGPYYAQHTLPKQGEAGGVASGTEAYYSFDYGNIHFICLDSCESSRSSTGTQAKWLRNDLANTTKDWVIVFWHHPPYSRGSHNSDNESQLIEMRQNIVPILEDYGVDLVLCGHSHSYERSFFIDGHYGKASTFNSSMIVQPGSGRGDGAYTKTATGPIPHSGAVFAVAGASGKISSGTLNHPAMFVSLKVYGSMVLDFDGNRLDAIYLDRSGSTRDSFSIVKGDTSGTPEVALTSPGLGAIFTAGDTIPLEALASDSDGSITKVEFYHGSTLIGTDTTSPYSYPWTGMAPGSYNLTARATDNSGKSRTSAAVGITVNGAPPPGSRVVALRQGAGGYLGMTDTHILADVPNSNFGNAASLRIDGNPQNAALLRWDLSSLPPGTTVTGVSMVFHVADSSASPYAIYALTRGWSENEATWPLAAAGAPWATAGASAVPGDREALPVGALAASTEGSLTVPLNALGIAKVQAWINQPAANHGFVIQDYTLSSGCDLASSESATLSERPLLLVTCLDDGSGPPPPNQPPQVALVAPVPGTSFTAPAAITLKASATDGDGTISSVAFFHGTTQLGEVSEPPWELAWTGVAAGNYPLTARATDNSGASTLSAAVTVAVIDPSAPGPEPGTKAFRQGVDGYQGMTDTTLRSDAATSNFGNNVLLQVDGQPDYAALLKWDLSSIPAGSTVTAATLTFRVTDESSSSYDFYALNRAWTESGATWGQTGTGTAWGTAGAAQGSTDRGTQSLGKITAASPGTLTVTLNAAGIAKVQEWIGNPAANYGIVIQNYSLSSGFEVSSSEATNVADRPMLTVTWD